MTRMSFVNDAWYCFFFLDQLLSSLSTPSLPLHPRKPSYPLLPELFSFRHAHSTPQLLLAHRAAHPIIRNTLPTPKVDAWLGQDLLRPIFCPTAAPNAR